MAIRVPTPPQMQVGAVQPQVTPRAFESVQYRSNDFMGDQLQRLGQATSALAGRIDQARTDTALLEAQDAINKKRRELFDPRTGIYARQGADAVGVSDLVDRELEAFSEELLKGKNLSGSGREAVQRLLMAERQRGYEKAAEYELRAHLDYQENLQAAHLDAQYDSLFRNPGDQSSRDTAFTNIMTAAERKADQLGFSSATPEEANLRDQFIENELTKGLLAVAKGYAAGGDAVRADSFLDKNGADGDPKLIQEMRNQLKPQVIEQKAREYTSSALQADQNFGIKAADNTTHGTKIEFSLGPNRPNQPNQPVLNVIGTAVADVLGPGARVVVTSGQEGNLPQYGSDRHKTGNAADIKIFRTDGSVVKVGSPEMRAIAVSAASRGALGIGYGSDYMGDAMHIDLVPPDPAQEQWYTWGSGISEEFSAQLVQTMRSGEQVVNKTGLDIIMGISDPDVRDAALTRYRQEQSATYTQIKRNSELLADNIITTIEQAKMSGDKVPPLSDFLTPQAATVLGSNTAVVESAYNRIILREDVDPTVASDRMYSLLALSASANPADQQDFAEMDLGIYRHQVTRDQFDQLRLEQLKMRSAFGMDVKGERYNSNMTDIEIGTFEQRVTAALGSPKDEKGRARHGAVVMALVDWANGQKQASGKDPTEIELYNKAYQLANAKGARSDTSALGDEIKGTMADMFTAARKGNLSIETMRSSASIGTFTVPVQDQLGETVAVPLSKDVIDMIILALANGDHPGLDVSPASVLTVISRMPRQVLLSLLAEQQAQ